MQPDLGNLDLLIEKALEEDIGRGDITSNAVIDKKINASLSFVARKKMIVCGLPVMKRVFTIQNPSIKVSFLVEEGEKVRKGKVLARVTGNACALLAAERTALNFFSHLSSVATHTARFVQKTKRSRATILDTRKTTPGLRILEKYAVRIGGGTNHRLRLDDAVLIKDNHIAIAGGVTKAIVAAREQLGDLKEIEVECDSLAQVKEAIAAGADQILLDNMKIHQIRKIVKFVNKKVPLEVSGGVNLRNVGLIARTGVDYISIGGLTHSAPHIDIGLDFIALASKK
jgi:nicotinate-nucleotide pyrophosphorylase (carboxylating)